VPTGKISHISFFFERIQNFLDYLTKWGIKNGLKIFLQRAPFPVYVEVSGKPELSRNLEKQ